MILSKYFQRITMAFVIVLAFTAYVDAANNIMNIKRITLLNLDEFPQNSKVRMLFVLAKADLGLNQIISVENWPIINKSTYQKQFEILKDQKTMDFRVEDYGEMASVLGWNFIIIEVSRPGDETPLRWHLSSYDYQEVIWSLNADRGEPVDTVPLPLTLDNAGKPIEIKLIWEDFAEKYLDSIDEQNSKKDPLANPQ